MARKTVPFGHAHKAVKCSQCGGTRSVLVDPKDARKGTRRCSNCGGTGEC